MKDTLKLIVQTIAGKTVKIKEEAREGGIVFDIVAPQEKIGLLIGKGGKTIKSIKVLLGIKNSFSKERVFFDLCLSEKE